MAKTVFITRAADSAVKASPQVLLQSGLQALIVLGAATALILAGQPLPL